MADGDKRKPNRDWLELSHQYGVLKAEFDKHVKDLEEGVEGAREHVVRIGKELNQLNRVDLTQPSATNAQSTGNSPAPMRVCSCGKVMRSKHAKCADCRRRIPRSPCLSCGKPTRKGQLSCSACIADATADHDYPFGWVRERPGGPLVGVRTAHNSDTNCSAHDLCDRRMRDAA